MPYKIPIQCYWKKITDRLHHPQRSESGNKAIAYVGTKEISSVWAALQQAPLVELYRLPTALSNYVITHIDGGASAGIADSMQMITSAT